MLDEARNSYVKYRLATAKEELENAKIMYKIQNTLSRLRRERMQNEENKAKTKKL